MLASRAVALAVLLSVLALLPPKARAAAEGVERTDRTHSPRFPGRT